MTEKDVGPLLEQALKDAGYRITPPRRAVLRALDGGPVHVSAAEVLSLGRKTCRSLSRASVYRTLEELEAAGALRGLPSPEGRVYVRVTDGHHHLVCRGCGAIEDFDGCALCDGWTPKAKAAGFAVAGHLLEVFGLCKSCREREAKHAPQESESS